MSPRRAFSVRSLRPFRSGRPLRLEGKADRPYPGRLQDVREELRHFPVAIVATLKAFVGWPSEFSSPKARVLVSELISSRRSNSIGDSFARCALLFARLALTSEWYDDTPVRITLLTYKSAKRAHRNKIAGCMRWLESVQTVFAI